MYDPKADDDANLRSIREDFRATSDYRSYELQEAHRAGRFYHNTLGVGQWESRDYQTLREEGRPAITFNICGPTIDKAIGMQRDGMRKAAAMPVGGEDAFISQMVNALSDRFYKVSGLDNAVDQILEYGTIHGEGNLHMDIQKDPDNPAQMKGIISVLPRYDVFWDAASRAADRSDAGYFFYAKWLSKVEFRKNYPEHMDSFPELEDRQDDYTDDDSQRFDWSESGDSFGWDADGYNYGRWTRLYYDAKRNKVRVIHCEYKVPEKRYWLTNTETQESERITESLLPKVRKMIQLGVLQGVEVTESWGDKYHVIQFIGSKILHQGESEQPYEGFSMDSFTYAIDSETGAAYGAMRNLFDPQMEVNKSRSASLEQYTAQSKPGVIAEKSAIMDEEQFQEAYGTAGGISYVEDGALSGAAIIERSPAQISTATEERNRNAIEMMQRVSGVGTQMETPAAQGEAYATQALRYHQARLGQSSVVDSYENFLVRVQKRVVETLVRGYSDIQLSQMLGNSDKYGIIADPQTGEGMVAEYRQNAETGQQEIEQASPIRDLRELQYDIELETVSENGSMRMIEGQHLMTLHTAGIPVPPELLVSKATSSRHEREQMVAYAEEQGQAQQRAGEQQAKQASETMAQTLAIEQGKAEETARNNRVKESLQSQKQLSEHETRMLAILEQADTDEKNALLNLAKIIETRQTARTVTIGGAQ